MNWKQINSGLWKVEEGGYEIFVSELFDEWYWYITLDLKHFAADNRFHEKFESAKQAAEEAYLKLVK